MQILLNGEELDVQFEHEKLLAEVLRGIANWMESDAYYLQEFILDGAHYTAQEPSTKGWDFDLFQQELAQIHTLKLFSAPMQAYSQVELSKAHQSLVSESENTILESLNILCDYFRITRNTFENQQFIFLQDFFSDSEPLLELLHRSVLQVETSLRHENHQNLQLAEYDNPLIGELTACLGIWNYFQDNKQNAEATRNWNTSAIRENKDRMLAILQDIFTFLKKLHENYITCLSRPQAKVGTKNNVAQVELAPSFCDINISEIQAQLSQKIQELEEAVVQLQSGQVQQILCYVSELSLLLEQLLQQNEVQRDKKLAALFIQMKPFLQELIQAIEETDIIVIGDLVEYEIIPLIQQLSNELTERE